MMNECLMVRMQDLMLQHAPSASFGSLMAILALFVSHHINDITTMLVSLGEAETHQQQKGVSRASSVSQTVTPMWVTRTQM